MDIDALSLKELKDLRVRIDRAIESFEGRRKREAAEALEAKAKELGFSLKDLVDLGTPRKRAAATAKYANPENPADTWTGRGRKPRWFVEATAAGRSPEDMAI
ncbi:H-NS histone family protein [Falsirhodobacter sp. 20TX0035]|uniref:H-NS histone family protein n=1 Tax=Falsirhodobacter sp. 20TX0035 TaxID=3022019 RepID=UPI00232B1050|nr:H-NS histone family protein [Falsirhodobacter sp. 20TX0035]MDB6452788.1 H-NS histone family protein [Falsirhodobacter sp. 20TX0035]